MADILDAARLERQILEDMRVELTDEFDKNFQRKAFFTDKWKARKDKNARGSLLVVSGAMRRSIRSDVKDHGVSFTSSLPYTTIHNEGGKGSKPVCQHYRTSKKGKRYEVKAHNRKFNMPKRQFIGDGKKTQTIIKDVIEDNLQAFDLSLTKFLKQ